VSILVAVSTTAAGSKGVTEDFAQAPALCKTAKIESCDTNVMIADDGDHSVSDLPYAHHVSSDDEGITAVTLRIDAMQAQIFEFLCKPG
jgi:hypothetical protein